MAHYIPLNANLSLDVTRNLRRSREEAECLLDRIQRLERENRRLADENLRLKQAHAGQGAWHPVSQEFFSFPEVSFRNLFETTIHGMALVASDGHWLKVNQALCDITGYAPLELLDRTCREIAHPDDLAEDEEARRRLLAGEARNCQLETRFIRKDGRDVWILLTLSLVRNSRGDSRYFFYQVIDIDARKRHEQELCRARRDAEMASRAKSRFLANMSHEIRTPMSAILGMCELMQETRLTKTQDRYVHAMERSGRMLLALINDILDLSKIEANQLVLERIPFSLDQLLDELLEMFGFMAASKGIGLEKRLVGAPLAPQVLGDPNRLRQVLVNLLGNAIKFTCQGGVTLGVEQQAATGRVLLWVADTGPGIPAARRKEIFMPFQQADASITRRHGGTGLGLTICRRLVDLMGGELTLTSAPGQGSVFTFAVSLPVCDPPVAEPEKNAASVMPCAQPALSGEGLEVLLAEDTEEISLMIEAYLQTSPHRLTIVRNGAEAVALASRRSFDLVLMDLQMPVMDGYAATRAIRKREAAEGRLAVPILALTAHAFSGESARIRSAGFDMHLTKPIGKQRLLEVLACFPKER
ncbi:MAG: PAS domain S-box protein [Magnetococcales bacterium]|nr:PAS domain S-box protein [Magnetococcales bacterium]